MISTARIERPQSYRGGSASREIRSASTVETDLVGRCSRFCEGVVGVVHCEYPFVLSSPAQCPVKQGREELLTAAVERGHSDLYNISLGEWPRLPFTARIERARFYCAFREHEARLVHLHLIPCALPYRPGVGH